MPFFSLIDYCYSNEMTSLITQEEMHFFIKTVGQRKMGDEVKKEKVFNYTSFMEIIINVAAFY